MDYLIKMVSSRTRLLFVYSSRGSGEKYQTSTSSERLPNVYSPAQIKLRQTAQFPVVDSVMLPPFERKVVTGSCIPTYPL